MFIVLGCNYCGVVLVGVDCVVIVVQELQQVEVVFEGIGQQCDLFLCVCGWCLFDVCVCLYGVCECGVYVIYDLVQVQWCLVLVIVLVVVYLWCGCVVGGFGQQVDWCGVVQQFYVIGVEVVVWVQVECVGVEGDVVVEVVYVDVDQKVYVVFLVVSVGDVFGLDGNGLY